MNPTPYDILIIFLSNKLKGDKIITTKQIKALSIYNKWKESTFTRKFREFISKGYIEVEKLNNETWYLKKIKE
tara:strand:+ start:2777 stop:2995 length:219 start_codon:yes stop_codon:yes gene_type:complete